MNSATTLGTSDCLVGDEASVLVSCFGIEFHPVGFAPFGELVRVNVYAHDPMALGFELLASALCGGKPLLVGPMEFVAVLEQGAKPVEVLGLVPSHTDDLNLHGQPPGEKPNAPVQPTAQEGLEK